MNSQITVFQYNTTNSKMWGYRFEIAPIGGKRKWCAKRGFTTRGDALRHGREAQEQYEKSGAVCTNSDISYSDFIDKWIDSLHGTLKSTTIENYIKKANLYLKPHLGSRKLSTISMDDIRRLMLQLSSHGCVSSAEGLALNTMSVISGMLQQSFQFAVNENILSRTPITGKLPCGTRNLISIASSSAKPHVYIPPDRIDDIFNRFPYGSPNHIPMMFGYRCGLRIGEAFAVTWDDIDFEKRTLSVTKQIQWVSNKSVHNDNYNRRVSCGAPNPFGHWYFAPPKYNSIRTIKIDDELINMLMRTKAQQEKDKQYYGNLYVKYYSDKLGIIGSSYDAEQTQVNFVNVRSNGEYISPRTMQYTSDIIHKQMGYPDFDFHSFRHTHATMLVEHGAMPAYVQHRLGHKNMEVTLRVYFHYTDTMEESGYSTLNAMFNAPTNIATNSDIIRDTGEC